ncbi:MAG: poly(beta-D-mannuronate) O-acetylase, partial [Bacteroidetes bacterium]|nr:poly(beta-D-mannuronate) O-acetylase [Bacteroidota bacterium]
MSWKPVYGLLLLASTVVDYIAALKMGSATGKRTRLSWLIGSLCINLGILATFKYLDFFAELFSFSSNEDPVLQLILPIGISFYTFQTLSYIIDVYRRKVDPEKHFGYFALYVSYFPQLLSGPIERPNNLLPQLHNTSPPGYDMIRKGLL